jgi:hypothetical protein
MKITRRQLRQIIHESLNEVKLPIPRQLKVLSDMVGSEPMPKLARALSNARDTEDKKKIEDVSDDTIKKEMMKMDEFDYEATYRWVIENKSSIPDKWIDIGKGFKIAGGNTTQKIRDQFGNVIPKTVIKNLPKGSDNIEKAKSIALKALGDSGDYTNESIDRSWLKIAGIIK